MWSCQVEAPRKDKSETDPCASIFLFRLNSSWVMRWFNELQSVMNTHTNTSVLSHTHKHIHTRRQTQSVLLERCGQSGPLAGLVTSIRHRVRVWAKGQKTSRVCRPQSRERVSAPFCGWTQRESERGNIWPWPRLKCGWESTIPECDLSPTANQKPGSQDLYHQDLGKSH